MRLQHHAQAPSFGRGSNMSCAPQGMRLIVEKVVHHPTIIAGHGEGRGWMIDADTELRSKFWGRSIDLIPVGALLTLGCTARREPTSTWDPMSASVWPSECRCMLDMHGFQGWCATHRFVICSRRLVRAQPRPALSTFGLMCRCHPAAHGGRRGVPMEQGHEHGVQPHHRQALRRSRRHHARPQHEHRTRRAHEVQGAGPHSRPQPAPGERNILVHAIRRFVLESRAALHCATLSSVAGPAAMQFMLLRCQLL